MEKNYPNIKAIIMDIDGTLVNSGGIISKKTKDTLLKVQNQGMKLVLASGRPLNGMLGLAKELEMDRHHGICVCFNGAKVVDVETKEVLFDQTMYVSDGKAVLRHMKKFEVRPLIVKDDYAYVEDVYDCMVHVDGAEINIVRHESHDNHYLLCEVPDLERFADYPLNKIEVIGEPEYLQAHYEEMAAPFQNKLNSMFTASFYYEFTAKGIDKVGALDSVLGAMGMESSEMMAFGDAQNDISMIKYAGIGIAMGNAVDELKAVADEITDTCEEDGIARFIDKYI